MFLSGPSAIPKTSFKRKSLNCLRKPVAGLFFGVGGLLGLGFFLVMSQSSITPLHPKVIETVLLTPIFFSHKKHRLSHKVCREFFSQRARKSS